MKMYDGGFVIIVVVVITAFVVGMLSTKVLGPDNPVEEVAEDVIEAETGMHVDLTPKSPEKK